MDISSTKIILLIITIFMLVLGLWLMGVSFPPNLIIVGIAFVGVISVIVYFVTRKNNPSKKDMVSTSMHDSAKKFGVEWLKGNIYPGDDFYFEQGRGRTIEDLDSKRIYWGFKIRKRSDSRIVVFIVSKPFNGQMDMWDWYDYPSPKMISNPLFKIEENMRYLSRRFVDRKTEARPIRLYGMPEEEMIEGERKEEWR